MRNRAVMSLRKRVMIVNRRKLAAINIKINTNILIIKVMSTPIKTR